MIRMRTCWLIRRVTSIYGGTREIAITLPWSPGFGIEGEPPPPPKRVRMRRPLGATSWRWAEDADGVRRRLT